jgi:FkbM family methyltransferase
MLANFTRRGSGRHTSFVDIRQYAKKRMKGKYYRLKHGRFEALGYKAVGCSESDRYVFYEIFGTEDAYQRDRLVDEVRDGIVVEIGAHKGYFTLLAASTARRVYAYEIDRFNFRYLKKNISRSRIGNVECYNVGVSSQSGHRLIRESHVTDARHSFYSSNFVGRSTQRTARCTSLDDLVESMGLSHIDLMKLDCEGAEYDILLNASDDTVAKIKTIYAELHESASIPYKTDDLVSRLMLLGFEVQLYDSHQRDDVSTIMAIFRRNQV